MKAVVERNKKVLSICATVGLVMGWITLLYALVFIIASKPTINRYSVLFLALNMKLILSCFIVSSFLRYLLGARPEPGWFLRHADKVLYLYAAMLIVQNVCMFISMRVVAMLGRMHHSYNSLFKMGVNVIAVIGVALIIRRVLAIIEESRTLV